MPNPFVGLILLFFPFVVICLWNIIALQQGDISALWNEKIEIPEVTNLKVWGALFAFMIFQAIL
jgi:hypothetical protein